MAWFDTLTKRAVGLTSILIAGLLIGLHPDMTAALRVLCTLAVVAGWLAAGASRPWVIGGWVAVALLAPAPLRLLAGREGPILDVFWMAGLTASLLRVSTWGGWTLGGATRLLAAAWALTVMLGWPVLAARELSFDPHLMFDVGAINAWTGWDASHVVSWIAFVAWTHLLGLLWLDWVAAGIAAHPERGPRVLSALWIATTLASLVAIYQGLIDLDALNTGFWANLRRASGLMLDANAYGICAALAGPSALLVLRGPRAGAIGAAITAINVAGLWMSGSRTAALCGLIALGAAGIAVWRTGTHRRMVGIAAASAAIVAIAIVASGASGPLQRLFDRGQGTTGSFASIVLVRGPYGQAAHQIIGDYPLTGVGIGTYQHVAADYRRREHNERLSFDNAQNWWRHQAAELGLLGALPLFAWSALLAWQVVFGRSRSDRPFDATVVRGLLLALGICSIVQVPTQTPVVLLWFFVFVAWLPHLLTGSPAPAPRGSHLAALVLAIAYAAGHLLLARGPLAVTERARTFNFPYVVGAYPVERTETGSTFRWTREEARFIWPASTPWFVIDLWAHHPDIGQNPVTVTVATPCQTLLEQSLTDPERVTIGLFVPDGLSSVDATVRVSRTWQPSAYGEADSRRLGVGITADSVADPDRVGSRGIALHLKPCPPGR